MSRASSWPIEDRRTDLDIPPLALRPSLVATWALICGCLASGQLFWGEATALRLLAVWLVADATLGCVFGQLVALKRRTSAGADVPPAREPTGPLLVPYAVPGSPGQRLARWLSRTLTSWFTRVWPQAGRCGVSALITTGLALVLATYLGREILAVVSGGLFLAALLTALAGGSQQAAARWLEGLQVALAWLLGYLALAPWNTALVGLATLLGLLSYARRWRAQNGRALTRTLAALVWATLVLVLLVARQPLLAVVVAVTALAESIPAGQPSQSVAWPGWLVALLLVALAVPYWA